MLKILLLCYLVYCISSLILLIFTYLLKKIVYFNLGLDQASENLNKINVGLSLIYTKKAGCSISIENEGWFSFNKNRLRAPFQSIFSHSYLIIVLSWLDFLHEELLPVISGVFKCFFIKQNISSKYLELLCKNELSQREQIWVLASLHEFSGDPFISWDDDPTKEFLSKYGVFKIL
jgi:hypothetical protein